MFFRLTSIILILTLGRGILSRPDYCLLPSDSGPCEAYSEQFYFKKDYGHCEMFVYGGCGGNRNRFPTKEDCEKACKI